MSASGLKQRIGANEIGFDKGYSSLNFLLANPVARMISLDSYEHDYVPKGDCILCPILE